jgi:phosphoribosyl 1,2-cyclic phosphodiesterase
MNKEQSYKVKFYGTRGSLPVCDPDYMDFGGNTFCIAISTDVHDRIAIIDAGTGIRNLGKEITSGQFGVIPKEINLAFTHFHWDHIQGFPFFDPGYDPETKLNFIMMGKDRPINDLKTLFDIQMNQVYFPISLDEMGAKMNFLHVKHDVMIFNDTLVKVQMHSHPGTAYSMRLDTGDKSIVVCTDIEHGETLDEDIVKLARGADLLIHEAQYTTKELEQHRGWGHSSYEQAMELAEIAECKQLIMTHHDPDHDDQFLMKMEKQCQERNPDYALAREGMEIVV